MSIKGQKTSFAERVEIGRRWEAGQSDREIALALQRPLATVRKWRRRNQHEGRPGLSSQMGRPARGALSQFPDEIADEILQMRESHPGWGPLTILVELKRDGRFAGLRLPSRARIAAYLKQKEKVKKYERHQELPMPAPTTIRRPHQEWEVDAQGKLAVAGLGSASIINILDVFSHVKIDSLPCLRTTHANTKDYQLLLRRAFVAYGLPEQISFDHDSVFYDNQTASPFPTLLHLWLLALGVGVRFIHKKPPLEHARIERHHQTVTQQALLGQTFADQDDLQKALTGRIFFLNTYYPSRSLHGQAPLSVFPQAKHSPRPYRLEWERECLDIQRVYDYLAQGRWFRLTSSVGMFSLGSQRYNVGSRCHHQTLEITFDPLMCEFVCLPEKEALPFRLAAKGLSKETLMGELDPLTTIPAYQLALPWSPQAWRENILSIALGDTTL
jgi:transposase